MDQKGIEMGKDEPPTVPQYATQADYLRAVREQARRDGRPHGTTCVRKTAAARARREEYERRAQAERDSAQRRYCAAVEEQARVPKPQASAHRSYVRRTSRERRPAVRHAARTSSAGRGSPDDSEPAPCCESPCLTWGELEFEYVTCIKCSRLPALNDEIHDLVIHARGLGLHVAREHEQEIARHLTRHGFNATKRWLTLKAPRRSPAQHKTEQALALLIAFPSPLVGPGEWVDTSGLMGHFKAVGVYTVINRTDYGKDSFKRFRKGQGRCHATTADRLCAIGGLTLSQLPDYVYVGGGQLAA